MNIKDLLSDLELKEEQANEAEARYDADPENEELEQAFDIAYKREFEAMQELIKGIVKISDGKISPVIARIMVMTQREKLHALCAKLA